MKMINFDTADYCISIDNSSKECIVTKKEVIYKGNLSNINDGVLTSMKDDLDIQVKCEHEKNKREFCEIFAVGLVTLILLIGLLLNDKMAWIINISILLNVMFIGWTTIDILQSESKCKYIKKIVNMNEEDLKNE